MLLLADRRKIRGWADGTVILKAARDLFCDVVADFHVRREDEPLMNAFAMQGPVESRVEVQIPAANLLIDDRAHLPGPGIRGEFAALIAYFIRETEPNGPTPFFRNAHARANVVAHPLDPISIALVGKDVKAGFKPIREAMGNLNGFVLGVVGGKNSILSGLAAVNREIAMQLDHGAVRRDRVVTIDLDLVIVLSTGPRARNKKRSADEKGTPDKESKAHPIASANV